MKRIVFGFAVLCVLCAAEIALRFEYYRLAITSDPVLDEQVNAPGTIRWRREGNGTSHWAEHGIRRLAPPALDRPRILVLGDSFTEALQVDDGETFCDVAEAIIRRDGGTAQLVNAGASTRSLADYIALKQGFADLFSPSWTVVELGDSDVTADAWQPARTRFERAADSSLRVIRVPPPARGRASQILWNWRQRSSLIGYTVVRLGELRELAAKEPPLFRAADADRPHPSTSPSLDFPVEAELDALFSAFEGRLTVLYLSRFDPSALREPTVVEARVAAHAASRGIGVVATRSRFSSLGSSAPFGFANTPYNSGHMNALGHHIAGELLAAELQRRGVDGVR